MPIGCSSWRQRLLLLLLPIGDILLSSCSCAEAAPLLARCQLHHHSDVVTTSTTISTTTEGKHGSSSGLRRQLGRESHSSSWSGYQLFSRRTTGSSSSGNAQLFRMRGGSSEALSPAAPQALVTAKSILRGMDYLGTVSFALSGTVTAAQCGLDLLGCAIVGTVTAIGGGTIRDALFLNRTPFWTSETEYLWLSVLTSVAAFYVWPAVLRFQAWRRQRAASLFLRANHHHHHQDALDLVLDMLDAIGLSAFGVIGAQNALQAQKTLQQQSSSLLVCAICGMATATFGGVTRDVICRRPVRIAHSHAELYATPAFAGALTYAWLTTKVGDRALSPAVRIGAAVGVCLCLRFLALQQDWKLPTWNEA